MLFSQIAKCLLQILKRRSHKVTDIWSMTHFVAAEQSKIKNATGEFSQLINSIQTAVKIIDVAVRSAGKTRLFGTAERTNVQGEEVKKLDILANEIFINRMRSSYSVHYMISEETKDIIPVPKKQQGKYVVCFDPLDGSSNIDCLGTVGTIFGIYKGDKNGPDDLLPKEGRTMRAAGYAIYGSATFIVLCTGHGVNGFMLDPTIGEFILTDPNMKIPSKGNIYSINEGYQQDWQPFLHKYVKSLKNPEDGNKPYSQRYVGSMVVDVHRTIKYGGIFLYPPTKSQPEGKLRLLYECNPISYIIEQADGIAIDGKNAILDILPKALHHRCPIYLGSKDNVNELQSFIE